ncbi:MAG: FCD domain-containing protein [Myxococcales bacterium]|nr:FCD domain-containing protein [Myxococcales bacterium]
MGAILKSPADKPRAKAAVLVAHEIVRQVRARGLSAGDRLLSEQKMVERYGVARGTLREALRLLELHGVLRIRSGPGGGPELTTPGAEHLGSALALLLQFVDAPFRAVIEARVIVEPSLARLAAERASHGDLQALSESLERLGEQRGGEGFSDEQRRFHDLVAVAAGNPLFAQLLPALHRLSRVSGLDYAAEERAAALRALERIYKSIESGDGEQAEQQMRRLLSRALRGFDRHRSDQMERRVAWSDALD